MPRQQQTIFLKSQDYEGTSLSSDYSSFTAELNPPIDLRSKKNIKIALHSMSVVYSFVNISPQLNNNIISFYNNNDVEYIELKKGIYSLDDINNEIYEKISSNLLQQNITVYPSYSGNSYNGSVTLQLPAVTPAWSIDWDVSTLTKNILGFTTQTGAGVGSTLVDTYFDGAEPAQLSKFIGNSYLFCSACVGSYFGNKGGSNILYPINVNSEGPNETIFVDINNMLWMNVTTQYIESILIKIVKEDGSVQDLNGEFFSLCILLEYDD